MATSGSELEIEVARLRDLDLRSLRAMWRAITGRPAPTHLPRHLLLRILAYRIQADALGDLSREALLFLDRLGRGDRSVPLPERAVRPGTVLVREWAGARHHVMVDQEGFSWNGQTYRSLSEVAGAITGTKWSGPRFFGLKGKPASRERRLA
ncbi:DUF2924 domain-containing protein [uncultured Enterovirga sp.]|uniref:DUF2924 domain-containing protein n=1 Tax=uncultured Enterovirga sp. TaxID=2026352 RepID=UPI0035CB4BC7